MTVLAIGPGLGTSPEAIEFALGLLRQSTLPAVIDADALNALATKAELLPEIAQNRTLVLTPHPGEMARLAGISTAEIQANRLQIASDFAIKNQVILVLKGWRTLIAHPDGTVAVNTTGNPGMAKGGSGDLLTGMVAAMLAQHPKDPSRAVEAAVYLHGLAADITVRSPGIGGDQHTLLATDALANLHRAFRYHPVSVSKLANSGYVWLQGLPADVVSSASSFVDRHEQSRRSQARAQEIRFMKQSPQSRTPMSANTRPSRLLEPWLLAANSLSCLPLHACSSCVATLAQAKLRSSKVSPPLLARLSRTKSPVRLSP